MWWPTDISELLFPRYCPVCGRKLLSYDSSVCLPCLASLEYVDPVYMSGNGLEKRMWSYFSCELAAALLSYERDNATSKIIHAMKFYVGRRLCYSMGRVMGSSLLRAGFFEGVDLIIPVPLHPKRKRARGYNQSEFIARGVSSVAGIHVSTDKLVRSVNLEHQSSMTIARRSLNSSRLFSLAPDAASGLEGKHVLLVDDVITTGATMAACAEPLLTVQGVRVSVAAVSMISV